jgi:hypothetical protein
MIKVYVGFGFFFWGKFSILFGTLSHLFMEEGCLDYFWPKITHLHMFFLSFNINMWFSHWSSFSLCFFFSRDFVVWVRRCVVRYLLWCYLIYCIVVVFIWFLLKDRFHWITDLVNDLGIDVAHPETCIFQSL